MVESRAGRHVWPSWPRLVLRLLAGVAVLVFLSTPAQAGQQCRTAAPSVAETARALELGQRTAQALDQADRDVAVIARAGQNLRRWGQEYSHIGLVYRWRGTSTAPPVWRVVHKLNYCGAATADLYRQGLAEFFWDGLYEPKAAVIPLTARAAQELLAVLTDQDRLITMHEPAYSMLAYPWSTRYQQSNQWVLETIAMAMEPEVDRRDRAQMWLKFKGYQPERLKISAMKRLGARISRANIEFDDHPNALRFSNRIDTTSADSVLRWLRSARIGDRLIVVR